MADVSVTANNVAYVSGTTPLVGVAAESITAGQSIYYDNTAPGWRLAKSLTAGSAAKRAPGGISLTGAGANGYFLYAGPGTVINSGATLTKGLPYFLSGANAGGIAPVADITTNMDTVLVGFAATTANLVIFTYSPGISF